MIQFVIGMEKEASFRVVPGPACDEMTDGQESAGAARANS
jgi:hypothetical protein